MEQPAFTNETQQPAEVERKITITLHTLVGELLASGRTNEEILGCLQTEQELEEKEAQAVLRDVYDSWTSVRLGLNLQDEDDRNWHLFVRMKLLQTAISNVAVPSQNLALRILDSLAAIRGISTVPEQVVPLSIELVEKKPEPEPEVEPGAT